MKKLSDEQKMKRFIWRIRIMGVLFLVFAVIAYMTRFLLRSAEGNDLLWPKYQYAIFASLFPTIFLGSGSVAFGIVGMVRILLTRVSECQEQIKLLENQVSTLKGQEAESS